MAEELKNLIEKIQEEGVRAAEERAREIEEEAGKKAGEIIRKAEEKAKDLAGKAEERIRKAESSSRDSLKQAGRDMILSLRKEILAMLERLITSHVNKALSPAEIAKIIQSIVKECTAEEKKHLVISLGKEDTKKVEQGFLSALREETRKGITLNPSDDIRGGFTISFDDGKSFYDFTDKALAQYIALYVKPKLAEILQ